MGIINKDLYEKICEHINRGFTNCDNLDDYEKEELLILYMRNLGEDAGTVFNVEKFNIPMQHFAQYIKTGDNQHAIEMTECITKYAIEDIEPDLNDMFESVYKDFVFEKRNDHDEDWLHYAA